MSRVTAQQVSGPLWMVWDGSTNVTAPVGHAVMQGHAFNTGAVFCPRGVAEHLVDAWNAWEVSDV
jgi:hypothetical protein